MITEFLNRRADIERELAELTCNYATLLLEWKDAREAKDSKMQNAVNEELQQTNARITDLRKEYE